MAGWSFAEAIVWPVIPDFLLAPLIVGQPRRAAQILAGCVAGTSVGATLLMVLASLRPSEAGALLPILPLVFATNISTVQERIANEGSLAYLWQPISGIPFKVWGIVGGILQVPLLTALPIAILARALRMLAIALLALAFARVMGNRARDHALTFGLIYLVVFGIGWVRTLPIAR